jgi:hypothetical protein
MLRKLTSPFVVISVFIGVFLLSLIIYFNPTIIPSLFEKETVIPGWYRYSNSVAGWSLQYPKEWKVTEYIPQQAINADIEFSDNTTDNFGHISIQVALRSWRDSQETIDTIVRENKMYKSGIFKKWKIKYEQLDNQEQEAKDDSICYTKYCKAMLFEEKQVVYFIKYKTNNEKNRSEIQQILETFIPAQIRESEIAVKIPDPSDGLITADFATLTSDLNYCSVAREIKDPKGKFAISTKKTLVPTSGTERITKQNYKGSTLYKIIANDECHGITQLLGPPGNSTYDFWSDGNKWTLTGYPNPPGSEHCTYENKTCVYRMKSGGS